MGGGWVEWGHESTSLHLHLGRKESESENKSESKIQMPPYYHVVLF